MAPDMIILVFALIATSAVLVGVGIASLQSRLPRNRVVGVRVDSVRKSDEAWEAGHRAAGISLIISAIPPAVVAVALIVNPPPEVGDWILVYAVAGVITGGLISLAVRQADKAAQAVAPPD